MTRLLLLIWMITFAQLAHLASANTTTATTTVTTTTPTTTSTVTTTTTPTTTTSSKVVKPIFSPGYGTFNDWVVINITTTTAGALIFYTTDGTTPTDVSTIFPGSINVTNPGRMTINAIAMKPFFTNSDMATAVYIILVQLAVPSASPSPGFLSGQSFTVTLTHPKAAARIHYTTDGTVPTMSSPIFNFPLNMQFVTLGNIQVNAFAEMTDAISSSIVTFNYTEALSPPIVTPSGGIFTGQVTISFSSPSTYASFRFTTNGDDPTLSFVSYIIAPQYQMQALQGSGGLFRYLKIYAFKYGAKDSVVTTYNYTILEQLPPPLVYPDSGSVIYGTKVNFTATTPQTTIWYTSNNTSPYSDLFRLRSVDVDLLLAATPIPATMTVRAYAERTGYGNSTEVVRQYTILDQVPAPVISPASGTYSSISVTITSSLQGTSIYMTTNGDTPSATNLTSSFPYIGPMVFTTLGSLVISAIAVIPGKYNSPVATQSYILSENVPAIPVLTPNGGIFKDRVTITMTSSSSNVQITWTSDGSTPLISSTKYGSPVDIPIVGTFQVRCIAYFISNFAISFERSATFQIMNQVQSVQISPSSGTFSVPTAVTVTLACPTANATIYYTTDGSLPSASSSSSSSTFSVKSGSILKFKSFVQFNITAYATLAQMIASPFATSGNYQEQLSLPSFSPASGSYSYNQMSVSITTNTSNAILRYSLTNTASLTDPILSSSYLILSASATPITVSVLVTKPPATLQLLGSAIYYVFSQTATPLISPNSGVYSLNLTVNITAPLGDSLFLSVNGSSFAAAASSPALLYLGVGSFYIQVYSTRSGMAQSIVATANYTVYRQTNAPVILPNSGLYSSPISINMAAEPSAQIYYTLDGSLPTVNSLLFSGLIAITTQQQLISIRAIATNPPFAPSSISEATFIFSTTDTCGNGKRGSSEQCDDGNTIGGDGCSSSCSVEARYTCTRIPGSLTDACSCSIGYYGATCAQYCDAQTCLGRGLCNTITGFCLCFDNIFGASCERYVTPALQSSIVAPANKTATFPLSGAAENSLIFSATSLTQDTNVSATIWSSDVPVNPNNVKSAGSIVVNFGPEGLIFGSPVILKLRFDTQLVSNIALLKVHYYNTTTAAWEPVAGIHTVDTVTGTVAANLTHFSRYSAFSIIPSTTSSSSPSTPSSSASASSSASSSAVHRSSVPIWLWIVIGVGSLAFFSLCFLFYVRCREHPITNQTSKPISPPITPFSLASTALQFHGVKDDNRSVATFHSMDSGMNIAELEDDNDNNSNKGRAILISGAPLSWKAHAHTHFDLRPQIPQRSLSYYSSSSSRNLHSGASYV